MSYQLQAPSFILCLKSSLMVLRNLDTQQTTATRGSSPQQVNLRVVEGGGVSSSQLIKIYSICLSQAWLY